MTPIACHGADDGQRRLDSKVEALTLACLPMAHELARPVACTGAIHGFVEPLSEAVTSVGHSDRKNVDRIRQVELDA